MGSGPSTQVQCLENKQNTTTVSANRKVSNTNSSSASSKPIVRAPSTPVVAVRPTVSEPAQASADSQKSPKPQSHVSPMPNGLEIQLQQLQKELDESESEKLDLHDRIQALEERIREMSCHSTADTGDDSAAKSLSQSGNFTNLQETLKAKDSYIQQMEKQLATVQTESNKTRMRLKKRIKALTAQLNEAKQENSIAQLELKERNADLQDKLHRKEDDSGNAPHSENSMDEDKDSKFKIILDLSAEVSEQANRIASLETQLKERDGRLEQLKREVVQHTVRTVTPAQSDRHQPRKEPVLNNAPLPSRNSRHMKRSGPSSHSDIAPVESAVEYSSVHNSRPQNPQNNRRPSHGARPDTQLTLQRQSTALSDSDTDWEVDMSPSKIHSAPAGPRVKSAATTAEGPCESPDGHDKWSLATDDNDLTFSSEAKQSQGSSKKNKRKSALKTKLERVRNERAQWLIGPSLAFETPTGDQFTDTSCNNTPTPGRSDLRRDFSTTEMTFAV